MKIDVTKIVPNPEQPRRDFDPAELAQLAESIRQHGLINPISVEETGDIYVLIDGERRWKASKIAGLAEIEADVRPSVNGGGAQERLTLALVANLHRADMNPLEEGWAYARLRELGLSVKEIAEKVGVHTATINNKIAILEFEPEIQQMFAERQITVDPRVIAGLRGLADDSRVRIMRGLIQRKATNQTVIAACRRLGNVRQYKQKELHVAPGEWSMTVMIDQDVPRNLAQAARETCLKCVLFEHANLSTCRDCPGVDLLKRLISC